MNLTGALIFDDQWFLQAPEGDRAIVWQAFERIRDDDRHANVVIAEIVGADRRIFANWWMGLATRNTKTEPVFAPFLDHGILDPRGMTAAQMLSLMVALANFGLSRELAALNSVGVWSVILPLAHESLKRTSGFGQADLLRTV